MPSWKFWLGAVIGLLIYAAIVFLVTAFIEKKGP